MTRLSGALALVPTAVLAAVLLALAWREQGSVLAEDWVAYALIAGLLAATVVASGTARSPTAPVLVGLASLTGLAFWTAASALWSPAPALARDEALLVLFYALVLAVPILTLRSERDRLGATALVVAASVLLAVAISARLLTADSPADLFWSTRLGWPIRYPGAEAAVFLVCFWPAVALAARRQLGFALRGLALGGAVALLAGWLMTQSRAGAVALALSAVVVFAISSERLRLLVPVTLAAALAAAAYNPLTAPWQEQGQALEAAIQGAGTWALLISLAGLAVGLVYARADARVEVPPRFAKAAGVAAMGAVVAVALVGVGWFALAVDDHRDYVESRWEEFKQHPEYEAGSSHLTTIAGSRYDTWRVALEEFREHPLVGAGGRAFGPAYLREGTTSETPQRAHSLELDLLSETGVIGLALFLAGLLPFAWIALRRARSSILAAGVVGAAAYWLAHASGDWTWTFPAAGLPFFLLLGIGAAGYRAGDSEAAGPDQQPTTGRLIVLGIALAGATLLAFAPPWLSARYTARALEQPAAEAADDLRWARRLDPLSTDPLVAEAVIAPSPEHALPPLLEAVEREPSTMALRYLLAVEYLDAGRRADARRELREALRLSPRSRVVRQALNRIRDR